MIILNDFQGFDCGLRGFLQLAVICIKLSVLVFDTHIIGVGYCHLHIVVPEQKCFNCWSSSSSHIFISTETFREMTGDCGREIERSPVHEIHQTHSGSEEVR